MKFLVLMLSMAAAAVLAAPTPAAAPAANTQVVRAAEEAPKFNLPREVLRDVKATDGEMNTDGNWSPIKPSQGA
ncbi:hypothetical protein PG996_007698 [Apiospora saccharicola]|uniref:Uncharacterized protein n=1 Tax=Apiospora saccharicola TaxID=335842 RepID=A0ABR1VE50_9PEZI